MICHPENDLKIRYVLGENGINNLLVVCLNPSTANYHKHDGTTDNIAKISKVNGYDGWLLFNISPQRTPHPRMLDETQNESFLKENINNLSTYLNDSNWNLKNVWLAWGNNVNERSYLKAQALIILKKLQKYKLSCWCIKKTQKGHPFHPSKRSINSFIGPVDKIKLQPFDSEEYFLKIST